MKSDTEDPLRNHKKLPSLSRDFFSPGILGGQQNPNKPPTVDGTEEGRGSTDTHTAGDRSYTKPAAGGWWDDVVSFMTSIHHDVYVYMGPRRDPPTDFLTSKTSPAVYTQCTCCYGIIVGRSSRQHVVGLRERVAIIRALCFMQFPPAIQPQNKRATAI